MSLICPTVLAKDKADFDRQMHNIANVAHRIQIDLTDGVFAKGAEIPIESLWWPAAVNADLHLMYQEPIRIVKQLLEHRPNLIIVHVEARGSFTELATIVKSYGVKTGLAILPETQVEAVLPAIGEIDHVLIFSGDLGKFGGHADMSLLGKVKALKNLKPDLEIGWDGGINDQNVAELAMGEVDVLNVGGFIQNSENPQHAYAILERIAEEAGTT